MAATASKEAEEEEILVPLVPAWLLSSSAEMHIPPSTAPSYLAAHRAVGAVASETRMPPRRSSASGCSAAVVRPAAPPPSASTATGDHAQRVISGFKLVEMAMRNGDTGAVVWHANDWNPGVLFCGELEAHLPASLLASSSVTRAITFSSAELMHDFRMRQRVHLHGECVEEHDFHFGFVIPGSTNSWEQELEVDADNALPAETLSGNLVAETMFYDKDEHLATAIVRIFYDAP